MTLSKRSEAGSPLLVDTVRLYGPGIDQLLAVRQFLNEAGQPSSANIVYWTFCDRQGTVTDVRVPAASSPGGYTMFSTRFDPFGQPSLGELRNSNGELLFSTSASPISYFHAGREYDRETGLYYNRARYFDARTKRFISEDPLGFAGGDTNLYRYCGNSPTNAIDPNGTLAFIPLLVYGGIALLGTGTGAVYYANHETDQGFEAGRVAPGIYSFDRMDWARYNRAQYIAAGGQVMAATGFSLAMAGLGAHFLTPVIGAAMGFAPIPTTIVGVGMTGWYGHQLYQEGRGIYRDWDYLSGPDRLYRTGMLVGPNVAGLFGGGFAMRDALIRKSLYSSITAGALAREASAFSTSVSTSEAWAAYNTGMIRGTLKYLAEMGAFERARHPGKRSPVLSVLYDDLTNLHFFGENINSNIAPYDLDPIIATRLLQGERAGVFRKF